MRSRLLRTITNYIVFACEVYALLCGDSLHIDYTYNGVRIKLLIGRYGVKYIRFVQEEKAMWMC